MESSTKKNKSAHLIEDAKEKCSSNQINKTMLYGDFLFYWLDCYVQPSSKLRTYVHYKGIIELHIKPKLGNLWLSEITPFVIQPYINKLLISGNLRTGGGLSPNSVNSVISILKNTLKVAYSLGLTNEYIGDKIRRPKQNEKRVECFSRNEQKKLEQYILDDEKLKYFGIVLCLYTGLRIGELLALEWTDISMEENEINVSKSCHYGKDKYGIYQRITEPPKTKSSIRKIPIPKQLMPYLLTLKNKSHSTHVVSNGIKLISTRSYQNSFSLLLKRLDLPMRGFHSLRHTFATRALECGMDAKTLSEILGHKTLTITLNRYAHSLTEHKKEMMNNLGNLL